tara:strand:- start:3690 stop:5357 length:1668 start_codon:yes stop_codon:yes gene_type:complete
MNSKALALIAGALSGAAAQRQKFKDEYRDKKERQREWMSTYGQRIIKDTETKSSLAIAAAGRLKRAGLEPTAIREIIEKNGVGSLVEMDQEVQQWEKSNQKKFSSDQLNQLYQGTEGWESSTEYSTYEDAIKAAFKAPELTATDTTETEPESWYQSMLGRIRGDDLAEGYDKFLEDDAEGFGGSSIRDVRRMENMPLDTGTEGAAIFDRSAFDTGEASAQDRASFTVATSAILRIAKDEIRKGEGGQAAVDALEVETYENDLGQSKRRTVTFENQLSELRANPAYADILKKALLGASEDVPAFNENPVAIGLFGRDYLTGVFNPDNAPTQEEDAPFANVQDELDAIVQKKRDELLAANADADVETSIPAIDASSLRTIQAEGATDPEKKDFLDRWFSENPGEQYVIADNQLIIYDPATDPYKTALPPEGPSQEDIRFTRGEDETQQEYLERIKKEIQYTSTKDEAIEDIKGAGSSVANYLLEGVDGLLGDLGGFAKQGGAAIIGIIPFAASILQVPENSVIEYLQNLSEAEFEEAGKMIREGAGFVADTVADRPL